MKMKWMVMVALVVAGTFSAQAAVYYWSGDLTGGSTAYTDGNSWTLDFVGPAGSVPDTGDLALVNAYGQTTLTIDAGISQAPDIIGIAWDADGGQMDVVAGGSITTGRLRLGHNTGNHGTLNMSGGYVLAGILEIGELGSGTANMSGDSILHCGFLETYSGTINMEGNAWFLINGDQTGLDLIGNGWIQAANAGESILETYNAGAARTEYTVIPEPATLGLFGLIGGGLLWIRKCFTI